MTLLALAALGTAPPASAEVPAGTAFTYQGRLKQIAPSQVANGPADFIFTLWNAETGGSQEGPALTFNGAGGNPPPLNVVNGLFSVELDFGTGVFDGNARWIQAQARFPAGSGNYVTMPRVELTPAPYAVRALSQGNVLSASDGDPQSAVFVDASGSVGIGTQAPGTTLEVAGSFQVRNPATTRPFFRTLSGAAMILEEHSELNARVRLDLESPRSGRIRLHDANNRAVEATGGGILSLYRGFVGNDIPIQLSAIDGEVRAEKLTLRYSSDIPGDPGLRFADSAFANRWCLRNDLSNRFHIERNMGGWGGVMTLTPSGNVGIGIANPSAKLDVNGDIRSLTGIIVRPNGPTVFNFAGSNGMETWHFGHFDFKQDPSGVSSMLVTNSGNVGVGTTSPAEKLDIAGVLRLSAISSTPAATSNTLIWGQVGVGARYSSNRHVFDVSGDAPGSRVEAMRISDTGNVGIGISAPAAKLHVAGSIRIDNGDGTGSLLRPDGVFHAMQLGNGNHLSYGGWDFRSIDGTQSLAIIASNTGNVGIGQANPSSKLHVQQASDQVQGGVQITNATLSRSLHLWMDATPRGRIDAGLTGDTAIAINSGGAGNVGIGRAPAANKLEVEGTASKSVPGDWLGNSDRRIKCDIRPVEFALDTLGRIQVHSFGYTDAYRIAHPGIEDRRYLNVIAQEFAEVFPDHVKSSGEKLPDGSDFILQVDPWPLTIYSVAAIQELHAQVQSKDAQIAQQTDEIADLKARLAKVEAFIESQTANRQPRRAPRPDRARDTD